MALCNNVAVLVACGSNKSDDRQPAWKLYESVPFEKNYTAAQMLGQPFIMSAKHGLVRPMQRLDPYDKTLKNMDKPERLTWAENVWKSLRRADYQEYVFLGGRDYVDPLLDTLEGPFTTPDADKLTVHDPYKPTSGIGQQAALAGSLAEAAVNCDTVSEAIAVAQDDAL